MLHGKKVQSVLCSAANVTDLSTNQRGGFLLLQRSSIISSQNNDPPEVSVDYAIPRTVIL